jgi:hypothetical protein
MIEGRLWELLDAVRRRAGPAFTGIGVVVASDVTSLPIAPLRQGVPDFGDRSVVDVLASISVHDCDLHDGFHVLSPVLRIELFSQYLAPPVRPISRTPSSTAGGARYMTALLASSLPDVVATGLATADQPPIVFLDGAEVAAPR